MIERPLSMREVPGSIPGFSNETNFLSFFLVTTIFASSEVFFFFNLFVVATLFLFFLFLSEAYRGNPNRLF